ncbi:MAG: hypothetical protein ABIO70_11605 [Pseudomonadota bacterium]
MLGVLTAIALAGAAAAEPAALEARRAVLELILTQIVEGDMVLVAVEGERPDAWRTRVQRVRPDLPLRFVPLADDQPIAVQMALALGEEGARCGVSLSPSGGDRWELRRWGSCDEGHGVLVEGRRHLTREALRERVQDLAVEQHLRVVVAAYGAEAATMVATQFAQWATVRTVQIALQPDPMSAMPTALSAADAACGLLVRAAPDARWRVDEVGDCGPVPSTGVRVARVMADDPRGPEQLARDLSLRIVDVDGPADRGPDWSLRGGDGASLTSLHAALQLGDSAGTARLRRLRSSRALPALALGLSAGALQIAGLAQMIVGFDTASSANTYAVRTDGLQLGWTGVVVSVSGALVASGAPLLRLGAADRLRHPDRFYDRAHAEALVGAYDRDLARELGVDEPWGDEPEDPPEEAAP